MRSVISSPDESDKPAPRQLFCILSARSLPYASLGIHSLFEHSSERLALTLITDEESDKDLIGTALSGMTIPARHQWRIHAKVEVDQRADDQFSRHANLRQFRHGHPCWRKLTDPLLFAAPGTEIVILDPDLYFPNHFSFESTPVHGVLLMWQPPSCLLPDEVVERAFFNSVPLAHHVDIGVAQLYNSVDLDWLDRLIAVLGGQDIPRAMHVEAIVWAAMAMRMGGGYLDPRHWVCYQYQQWKRVALKLNVQGTTLLRMQDFSDTKCFHAGGIAKWWLKEFREKQRFPLPRHISDSYPSLPFEELTQRDHLADRRLKRVARRLGYYRLMGS